MPGINIQAWVFAIVHSVDVSSLRRRKLIAFPMDPEVAAAKLSVSPPQALTLEVNAPIGAMKGKREMRRDAVLMAGGDGMTYENIAAHLIIPIGTIKSRVSRGRNGLRLVTCGR